MTKIGFIGLGNMGVPMASNLAEAGFDVVVRDALHSRSITVANEIGAVAATTSSDFGECTIVVLMLPNADVVRAVALDDGLLVAMPEGSLLIDMSSSGPFVYDDLRPIADTRGIAIVDGPVSGNTDGAASGSLAIMAGGDDAALDRAKPIFDVLGRITYRTGPLGSGQAVKALNNLASAGSLMLTLELLVAAQRFGLDPSIVNKVLNASTGRNNSTDRKIEPFVLSRRFDSGFALPLMAKDVRTALAIFEATDTHSQLSQLAVAMANEAERELGDDADHTAVARYIEGKVGTELRGGRPG